MSIARLTRSQREWTDESSLDALRQMPLTRSKHSSIVLCRWISYLIIHRVDCIREREREMKYAGNLGLSLTSRVSSLLNPYRPGPIRALPCYAMQFRRVVSLHLPFLSLASYSVICLSHLLQTFFHKKTPVISKFISSILDELHHYRLILQTRLLDALIQVFDQILSHAD